MMQQAALTSEVDVFTLGNEHVKDHECFCPLQASTLKVTLLTLWRLSRSFCTRERRLPLYRQVWRQWPTVEFEMFTSTFLNLSNVETWQSSRASDLLVPQTRGSMPFYWSQRPNLKYKPKPIISKTTSHVRAKLQFLCAYFNNDTWESLMLTTWKPVSDGWFPEAFWLPAPYLWEANPSEPGMPLFSLLRANISTD